MGKCKTIYRDLQRIANLDKAFDPNNLSPMAIINKNCIPYVVKIDVSYNY